MYKLGHATGKGLITKGNFLDTDLLAYDLSLSWLGSAQSLKQEVKIVWLLLPS